MVIKEGNQEGKRGGGRGGDVVRNWIYSKYYVAIRYIIILVEKMYTGGENGEGMWWWVSICIVSIHSHTNVERGIYIYTCGNNEIRAILN